MGKTIYIVDDDAIFASLLKRKMYKHGFRNIFLFHSSKDLLSNLDTKPDLVFLDYDLDDYNGIDLLTIIKNQHPHTEVIMISAQERIKIINDAFSLGVHRYIEKGQTNLNAMLDEALLSYESMMLT